MWNVSGCVCLFVLGLHTCARLNDCSHYCFGVWDTQSNMLGRRCGCPPGMSLSGPTQCVSNSSAVLPPRCNTDHFECPTGTDNPGMRILSAFNEGSHRVNW